MRVKRAALVLVVGAILSVSGCQTGEGEWWENLPPFRMAVPEGSGLHEGQTVPVSIHAEPNAVVSLTMDSEDCGVITSPITTNEYGNATAVFTAGRVEEDCRVTITGASGSETSQASALVHPPIARAEVTPWTGSDTAPHVTISPKVSPDNSAPGVNRFEYFVNTSSGTSIQLISVTFATDATVKVASALGTNFEFLEPPPNVTSDDMKKWAFSEAAPLNSVTMEARSESNTGGTATFNITIAHPEGTSTLTLTPTGPSS
ncbi:hypothetical protein MYX82_04925 [Acidobacteria bacterium AH-259-D05]|nr:hypothetical protein [Acidobacteria bacterium AH-259-D05]